MNKFHYSHWTLGWLDWFWTFSVVDHNGLLVNGHSKITTKWEKLGKLVGGSLGTSRLICSIFIWLGWTTRQTRSASEQTRAITYIIHLFIWWADHFLGKCNAMFLFDIWLFILACICVNLCVLLYLLSTWRMLTVICYMYLCCKQNCLSRTFKFSKSKSVSRLKNVADIGIVVSEFSFYIITLQDIVLLYLYCCFCCCILGT